MLSAGVLFFSHTLGRVHPLNAPETVAAINARLDLGDGSEPIVKNVSAVLSTLQSVSLAACPGPASCLVKHLSA